MLYPNLSKAMKDEDVTKTDLANLLQVHFNTITAKLEGETTSQKANYQIGFTLIEAVMIRNIFFKKYDLSWLFDFQEHPKSA